MNERRSDTDPHSEGPDGTPALRIVRGAPTAEEVAVVAAVVSAVSAPPAATPSASRMGQWNDPGHSHRRYQPAGPGGWRAARG
ncbi:MAG: acyl-CoA carboxylase epsilon subunit [Actinomycetota bacterium]